MTRGTPLCPRFLADAQRVGVQNPERIRVLVVHRMPLPDNDELAAAARQTQIITLASRGVAFGYGIMIRGDVWGDRELMMHQLVHVVQFERSGGLESFVRCYLADRHRSKFSVGSLEEEARHIAREICAADPGEVVAHRPGESHSTVEQR